MITRTMLSFKLEKSNELITAHANLLLFAELMEAMKIEKLVNDYMPKPGSNRGYDAYEYIRLLMLALYGGGRSISDTRELRDDQVFRAILNMKAPSNSAIGDWLRATSKNVGIEGMLAINDQIVKNIILRSGLKEATLVIDPSIIATKKRDAQMTYAGHKGYRPHLAFIQELNLIVGYDFRDGNDNGRRLDLLKQVYSKLSSIISIKLCLLDGEFYQSDVINFLNSNGTPWIIAADQDSAVKKLIINADDWAPFLDRYDVKTDREITQGVHAMEKVEEPFSMAMMRWHDEKKSDKSYKYHCLATNIHTLSGRNTFLRYNPRAESENNIKETKYGFGMIRMPCGTLQPNALYFGIGILTANLFIAQKAFTLPPSMLSRTVISIRWLLSAAAKVTVRATSFVVHLAVPPEKFSLFCDIRMQTYALLDYG